MSNRLETDTPAQSLTGLVKGIVEDVQALVRQEFELAKAETAKQWERAVKAATYFGVAVVFALFAVALLTVGTVHLLHWLTGYALPLWACYAIVGGVCAVVTVAAGAWAYRKVRRIELIPRQTKETMKENVEWLKNQT